MHTARNVYMRHQSILQGSTSTQEETSPPPPNPL